ncbi:hypothetical protein VNI00_009909 [Paramarasmius palmivorus]|uniref:Uncharacterized protein n=1 Tax=Paramarasmius palmivorus TaxID=297713 RepID=A0AAW0CP83_9AGAR
MSQYPVPPPSYGAAQAMPKSNGTRPFRDEAHDPLLGSSSRSGPGAFYDQPDAGDVADDFKYGVTVSGSSAAIRHAFIRKVYTILLCQIVATCVVGGVISNSPDTLSWVQTHTWSFYVPLFGTLINLFLLYWQRHNHPWNLFLLSTFTALEAFTLGVVVSFYDNLIVLQALIITTAVFLGLTLFTFQSKYDFDGLGPWLFGGLIALGMLYLSRLKSVVDPISAVMGGFVAMFFPMSRTVDLVFAIGGCLIFSGYVIFDTHLIINRLSPDEYILGAIDLYLDFINLFLNILRILNDLQSDR